VVDLWADKAESLFRYLEVEVTGGARRVLLPINFARIRRDHVAVHAIHGAHFAAVPATRNADRVTLLEEERIVAYYGAGLLYASPSRADPLF
jgi:photosynthetic reaction center H subunit